MDVVPAFGEIQGFQTDPAPDAMPKGFMRRAHNLIPGNRLRGGYLYGSPDVVGSGSRYVAGLAWAPTILNAGVVEYGAALYIVDNAGSDVKIYRDTVLDGSTSPTLINTDAGKNLLYPLVFHRNLVIAPLTVAASALGARAGVLKKIDKTTELTVGGSPPAATKAASWGEYLLAASSDANPNRIWFSGVGTVDTWDTTQGYVDVPDRIVALYAKGNTIFVWTPSGMHMLVGDTPPPGGNLTLKKWASVQGCSDPRSIAQYKDYVIWANHTGVYKSDGSQPVCITEQGGISSYWQYVMAVRNANWSTTAGIACGIYENYLIVSVRKLIGAGPVYTFVTFICDLETNNWFTWDNLDAMCFATRNQDIDSSFPGPETFFGRFATSHIGRISPCFDPGSGVDDNGVTVNLDLWTPAYRLGGQGRKRIKRIFPSFLAEDVISGLFELSVNFGTTLVRSADPSKFSGSVAGPRWDSFTATGKMNRVAGAIGRQAESVWFNLTTASAGSFRSFTIGGMEMEVSGLDQARAGDTYA